MWLTGFDVPSLHTLYVDKPMKGHGLMQAIARVNRVYKDKQGGLIVDYLGIAQELKKALSNYTESGGSGKPTLDQETAIQLMIEKHEIVSQMFHGFNYKRFFTSNARERMNIISGAMEHAQRVKEKPCSILSRSFRGGGQGRRSRSLQTTDLGWSKEYLHPKNKSVLSNPLCF